MKYTILLLFTTFTMAMAQDRKDIIHFVSLNYAIQEGQFDGVASVADVRSSGDFGLGSEEKLKSELVLLDGIFYGIPSNGKVSAMKDSDQIAFAAMKFFKADSSFRIENLIDVKNLERYLDSRIDQNSFVAIKISGSFKSIEFRSFIGQSKPYKPVDEVPENKFRHKNIKGTIVGFFTPKSALVLNSPNYHFHFIDNNRKTGGHVLECSIESVTIELDYAKELRVVLPQKQTVDHVDLNKLMQPGKGG